MRAIRLPWKVARDLRDFTDAMTPGRSLEGLKNDLLKALDAALRPRKGAAPARARRTAKAKTRREKVAELVAQVFARADGQCECGCGRHLVARHAPEMDHFWAGANRRALESAEGCWVLAKECHDAKHASKPSRMEWLRTFLAHSARHGYDAEPQRKARAELENLQAGRAPNAS